MIIKSETIDEYMKQCASEVDPTGMFQGHAFRYGMLISKLEAAFASPAYMRELKRDLKKLQEESTT